VGVLKATQEQPTTHGRSNASESVTFVVSDRSSRFERHGFDRTVRFLLHKVQQHDDDAAMIGAIGQGMVPKHHDTPSPMIFAGLRIFNDNFTGGVYEHGTSGHHNITVYPRIAT
jgi:hypothetical protein